MSSKRPALIDDGSESVQALAQRLGVERRISPRVRYPHATFGALPRVFHRDHEMRVHDLSVGGLCLEDKANHLGPNVGSETEIELRFADGTEKVQSRIVGSNHDRRHIQFLNLRAVRVDQLRDEIRAGTAGTQLKNVMLSPEIWSALNGDSLSFENDVLRVACLTISGVEHVLYAEAMPTVLGQRIDLRTFHRLILFLVNIAQPTAAVSELLRAQERLARPA